MSAPFFRHAAGGAGARPSGEPAPWTTGRRLNVPLRIAAHLHLSLAEFSKEGGAAAGAGTAPLASEAIEVSGDQPAEDMVADALDSLPWTDLLMASARDRRRRDAVGKAAVEAAQRARA